MIQLSVFRSITFEMIIVNFYKLNSIFGLKNEKGYLGKRNGQSILMALILSFSSLPL